MIGEQNKRILNIILLMIKLTLFIIIPLIQNLVTEDVQRRLQLRLEKDTLIEMKL